MTKTNDNMVIGDAAPAKQRVYVMWTNHHHHHHEICNRCQVCPTRVKESFFEFAEEGFTPVSIYLSIYIIWSRPLFCYSSSFFCSVLLLLFFCHNPPTWYNSSSVLICSVSYLLVCLLESSSISMTITARRIHIPARRQHPNLSPTGSALLVFLFYLFIFFQKRKKIKK